MSEDSEKIAGMAIMSMARDIDEKDAEIERLRDEIQNRNAKINRLTEELRTWKDTKFEMAAEVLRAHDDETKEAEAEIERLREEVKLLNSFRPDAELARLRGLLREAIDADRDHYATAMAVLMAGCWHKRVREALGE